LEGCHEENREILFTLAGSDNAAGGSALGGLKRIKPAAAAGLLILLSLACLSAKKARNLNGLQGAQGAMTACAASGIGRKIECAAKQYRPLSMP